MDEPVEINTRVIDGLRQTLGDNFPLLINTYIADCGARLERLSDALDGKDHSTIMHEAHGIKGSSSNLGISHLAEICGALEKQARANDDTDLEQNFTEIKQYFAAVAVELKQLI